MMGWKRFWCWWWWWYWWWTLMMMTWCGRGVGLDEGGEGRLEDVTTSADWSGPMKESAWRQWEEPVEFFSEEQELMHVLVSQYENSVRPVYNASRPVDVKLGLTLTQILDLDEKNQVLTTNVWLEAEWYDERLGWNSTDYGGISSIRIPCHRIWLPDIVLYNSVDDYTSGYMPSLAMVYDDSRVFWGPVIRFRSSCKIDITYFPFDDQVCSLKLGSWAYNGFQVNVWNRSNTMDLSNLVDNGEWELVAVKVERNVVTYNCCDEPFPDVTFFVHLRRRVKYYFMNIIIPCIILSCLCLAGFLLPPESGEKITLGLSVLLTITVFMLMVADKMPQTSESISVISIYLMVVLTTSCMSVLSSVWVLSIHHQRGKPCPVPRWLSFVVFRLVARVVCVSTASGRRRRRRCRHRRSDMDGGSWTLGDDSARGKLAVNKLWKQSERKTGRSPRRGRVAMEESEYLRMEHWTSKTETPTLHPSTQPLLHPPAGREGGGCGAEGRHPPPHPPLNPDPLLRGATEDVTTCPCSPDDVALPDVLCPDTDDVIFPHLLCPCADDVTLPGSLCRHGDSVSVNRERASGLPDHSALYSTCVSRAPRDIPYRVDTGTHSATCLLADNRGDNYLEHGQVYNRCDKDDVTVQATQNTSHVSKTPRPKKEECSPLTPPARHDTADRGEATHSEHGSFTRSRTGSTENIPRMQKSAKRDNSPDSQRAESCPVKNANSPGSVSSALKRGTTSVDEELRVRLAGRDVRDPLREDPIPSCTKNPHKEHGAGSSPHTAPHDVRTRQPAEHNAGCRLHNSTQPSAHTHSPRHTSPCKTQALPHSCNSWYNTTTTTTATSTTTTTTTTAWKERAMIQKLMTMIQCRHREEVGEEVVYREWHDVACVLDRLLFYAFLVITIVSSAVVLEMRPGDLQF